MTVTTRSRRAEYESMTRGELIDTLCALDRSPPAESARLLSELRLQHAEIAAQNEQLREAQAELEETRDRYRDLFEAAPVAYCTFDRNGVIHDANAATATLLRVTRPALIGVPLSRIVTVREKQTFVDHLARCLEEQVRVTSELAILVRGRGEMVVEMVSTPLSHPGSRGVACRTMLHDLTRLKRSESALRFVTGVDEALSAAADTRATLETIAAACVPALGDACFVDLCEGDEWATRRAMILAPGQPEVAETLADHASESAWRHYEAQLARTLMPAFEPASAAALGPEVERRLGARALMLLPLSARGRTLGVLGVIMTVSGRTYALHDLELAQTLAPRFAMALANSMAPDRGGRSRQESLLSA